MTCSEVPSWQPLATSEGDKVKFTVYGGSKNMTKTTQTFLRCPIHLEPQNGATLRHFVVSGGVGQLGAVDIWQVLRLQVDWATQECLSCFCHIFAPSIHCKYDFIPFTCRQWLSTWNLRTCHITLTAVLSKTEYSILYVYYRIVYYQTIMVRFGFIWGRLLKASWHLYIIWRKDAGWLEI